MADDNERIIKLVEDKVNQMLGTIVRKDTSMLNRMPTGGSIGDYKLVNIAGETRLCFKTNKGWMYVVLQMQRPSETSTDTELHIDGIVYAGKGLAVGDSYVGVPVAYQTYISALQWSGPTLQYKTIGFTFVGGILVQGTAESAWQNVP